MVGSESDTSYTVHTTTPPRLLAGPELRAARALHRALEDFGTPSRPYNSYVLPRQDDGFWVYFIPAQTDARAFPHGGDVRYHVAENGRTIIGRHQMHVSIMNAAAPPNAVSGVHTVVSEDLPQDTDVFLVLRANSSTAGVGHDRKPSLRDRVGWIDQASAEAIGRALF